MSSTVYIYIIYTRTQASHIVLLISLKFVLLSTLASVTTQQILENVVGDIAFIGDASSSTAEEFQAVKDFMIYLMNDYGISQSGTHAAVITSDDLKIKLNQFTDIASFRTEVDNIAYIAGGLKVKDALIVAKNDAFSPTNGGRSDAKNLLVLITDGIESTENVQDVKDAAEQIRAGGISILVIGVGKNVDINFINNIAGGPLYSVSSTFAELTSSMFVAKMYQTSGAAGKKKRNSL